MPRLWNATIAAHREDVHGAILDAAASLASERGMLAVTMSAVAEQAGIGRATLYKYFPDVETILRSWHDRQIATHLAQLTQIYDGGGSALDRLRHVFDTYAFIRHEHHDPDLAAVLHRGSHLSHASGHLNALMASLIREAAAAGAVRTDIDPSELAVYCTHALGAAASLPSKAAVRRLVDLTAAALHSTAPAQ